MPELHRRGAFSEGGVPVQSIFRAIGEFIKKADMLLLSLCITATVFGIKYHLQRDKLRGQ